MRIDSNIKTSSLKEGTALQLSRVSDRFENRSTLASLAAADEKACCNCFQDAWQAVCNFFSWMFCCYTNIENRLGELAKRDGFIWFYDAAQNSLTAFLGNFHRCRIKIYGIDFKCAEGAFQAAKFRGDLKVMASFANLTGDQAFRRARKLTADWTGAEQEAWKNERLDVMREVLMAKFSQNADLKRLLLATSDAYLLEHTPVVGRDDFWADNCDGTGENNLGQILMETRGNLGGEGVQSRRASFKVQGG